MLRTLFAIALMLMLASPAIAQDDDDLLAGFKLGKFHATAKLLAADLIYIDALTNEMNIAEITDENYQSGVITDDDILNAQLVLAYSIWRIQFIVQPACESGLEDDSFDHLALEEFREPTQAILTELLRNWLPAKSYELQYSFSNGSRVDAVIRLGEYLVGVDAKFPLESVRRSIEESGEGAVVTPEVR